MHSAWISKCSVFAKKLVNLSSKPAGLEWRCEAARNIMALAMSFEWRSGKEYVLSMYIPLDPGLYFLCHTLLSFFIF